MKLLLEKLKKNVLFYFFFIILIRISMYYVFKFFIKFKLLDLYY